MLFIGTKWFGCWLGGLFASVRYLDIRIFEQFALTAYGFNLALLIATVFVGKSVYGSKRWLELGGFVLQPSELMKVSLILALARVIHRSKGEEEYTIRHLIKPFALILLPCGLVVNQPDLGTTLIRFHLSFHALWKESVYERFCCSARLSGGLPVAWQFDLMEEYQKDRVLFGFRR